MSEEKKRHKSFGKPKGLKKEPITFDLYDEDFSAYPEVQGVQLLEFSKKISSESQTVVTGALLEFFEQVLYPESYERLVELWNDPKRIVPIETISDIVAYLVEEYTDRPTPQS
jgi:hypothetical protein